MLAEAIYVGIIATTWAYHRWFADKPEKPKPVRELTVPRTDDGAPIPLIYGRCRVNAPVLAWAGTPALRYETASPPDVNYSTLTVDTLMYSGGMLFVLGIPFLNGVNRIYAMGVGEVGMNNVGAGHFPAGPPDFVELADLTGEGGNEHTLRVARMSTAVFHGAYPDPALVDATGLWVQGFVEFLDGNDAQLLVDGAGSPVTKAGQIMVDDGIDPDQIPGFRNRMLACLTGGSGLGTDHPDNFNLGTSPSYPNLYFEVSSYPAGAGLAGTRTVGQEANPADVIFDLLTGPQKLGIPLASVDSTSFAAAAVTLLTEGYGYSRSIEDVRLAEEHILEILKHIDAVMYVDPVTLKWTIKLVRGDYTPSSTPHFTPANCVLEDWRLSGHTGLPNQIRVLFNDRQERYREGAGKASNDANAVGQNGEVIEVVLQIPGICTQAQADTVAERELSALSQPSATCRIRTSRTFAYLVPGDVFRLSQPELGVSEMLFRIAQIDRGTPGSDDIVIDAIRDQYQGLRGGLDEYEIPGLPAHRG